MRFRALCLLAVLSSTSAASPLLAADFVEMGRKESQLYPDFRLPRIDEGDLRLSDFRGKKVLLFHFASW